MKNLFFIFLILLVAVSSCENENVFPDRQFDIDIGFKGLNEGKLHNEMVDLMIRNWTQPETNKLSAINEIQRILDAKGFEFTSNNGFAHHEFLNQTNSCLEVLMNSPDYIVQRQYLTEMGLSSELTKEIIEFHEVFRDIQELEQVNDIRKAMLGHYFNNVNSLSEGDIVLYGAMIDVAIHSVEFWLPFERGGQNKYSEFKSKILALNTNYNVEFRGFWEKIFLADCAGAVVSAATVLVTSGGAAAIPNPLFGGIPTAGVVAVIGGAGASILKAI